MKPWPGVALLRRELLTSARRWQTFALLAVSLGLLTFLLAYALLREPMVRNPAALMELGRVWVFAVTASLYFVGFLLVPPLGAAAILTEHQSGNYELLANTLIRPWQIAVAKLANVVGNFLLFLVAALPLFAIPLYFVGVEWHQVAACFALLVVGVLAMASIGLVFSAHIRQFRTAFILTYVTVLLFLGVFHGPLLAILGFRGNAYYAYYLDTLYTMPLWMLLGAIKGIPAAGNPDFWALFRHTLLYQGGWIMVCMLLVTLRLRQPIEQRHAAAKRPRGFLPWRRAHFRPLANYVNPMYYKERLSAGGGRGLFRLPLIIVFAVFCVIVNYVCVMNRVSVTLGLVVEFGAVLVLAPASVATSFAREREMGNLDMLRMTLLTPSQVTWGKYLAGVVTLLPLFLVTLPLYLIMAPFGRDLAREISVPMLYIKFFVAMLLLLAISLWAGAFARRTATAIIAAYILCIGLFLLLPLGVLILTEEADFRTGAIAVLPFTLLIPGDLPSGTRTLSVLCGGLYTLLFFILTAAMAFRREENM
ncbi:MAG: ABC transporter permease [Candidatus Hydrogenedentota bacterium]